MLIYLNFLSLKIQKMCDPTQVTNYLNGNPISQSS